MKMIIFIAVLILYPAFSAAQDSSNTEGKEVKNQIKVQNDVMQQIQKRIGPEDNPAGNQKTRNKGKDVFIDKDGDGICDTRQGGMSFNKLRKRYGKDGGKGGGHKGNNNSPGSRR